MLVYIPNEEAWCETNIKRQYKKNTDKKLFVLKIKGWVLKNMQLIKKEKRREKSTLYLIEF